MGAWGYGNFENDDALDWLYELGESNDLSMIQQAIEAERQPGEFIDVYLACRALAAAEMLAALRGQPSGDLPQEAADWASRPIEVHQDLIHSALLAVNMIAANSELHELWDEAELTDKWLNVIHNLKSRLKNETSETNRADG